MFYEDPQTGKSRLHPDFLWALHGFMAGMTSAIIYALLVR